MSDGKLTESASTSTEPIEQSTTKESDTALTYRIATLEDCESLSLFVNNGFRGEISRQGWTTEDSLLGGQRLDAEMLADMINDNTNVILLFFDSFEKILVGCVRLQHMPEVKIAHLGLLVVRPNLQGQGYGKFILLVAENYAVNHWNVEDIEMTVIIHRPELVAYYNRRGYADTGQREPFPMNDRKVGIPKRTDLEFLIMKKCVKKI